MVEVEIPADFARNTIEREGPAACEWVAALPGLVAEFLRRWRCTPVAPMTSGFVGIILRVRREDGTPAVLKISFPHPGNRYEAHAFSVWSGRGAVLLYERDDVSFALLLEEAEWQTLDALGDVDEATTVCGRLARRLAVPAPPGLPRLSDLAEEWERSLVLDAEELGHPLSSRALGAAVATVRDLGRKQPDTLVHGDLHFGNVVRARREPWLVVDPKGPWGGQPAYGLRPRCRVAPAGWLVRRGCLGGARAGASLGAGADRDGSASQPQSGRSRARPAVARAGGGAAGVMPRVHLLCGLVGAGKTTHARRLAVELPAVRFSLDEWMLRLFDLPYDDPRYAAKVDVCTSLIWDTALQVLGLGTNVVLDWNQWSIERRSRWRRAAESAGYGVVLHYVDVSLETAVKQTVERAVTGATGSHQIPEADVRHFETIFQPPSPDEGLEIMTISS